MHVNKVHRVTTIGRVAADLAEDENWLGDVANEMDAEDGLIWVYGAGDDGVMAFTGFGIETPHGAHQDLQGKPKATLALRSVIRSVRAYAG